MAKPVSGLLALPRHRINAGAVFFVGDNVHDELRDDLTVKEYESPDGIDEPIAERHKNVPLAGQFIRTINAKNFQYRRLNRWSLRMIGDAYFPGLSKCDVVRMPQTNSTFL